MQEQATSTLLTLQAPHTAVRSMSWDLALIAMGDLL